MCYPVTCRHCNKTTWDGCGNHIDSVKATVPADQWCTCPREDTPATGIGAALAGLFRR